MLDFRLKFSVTAPGACKLQFISEDNVQTFQGWLKYQGIEAGALSPQDIEMWRSIFDDVEKGRLARTKVGMMKLRANPGEHRYAVASATVQISG